MAHCAVPLSRKSLGSGALIGLAALTTMVIRPPEKSVLNHAGPLRRWRQALAVYEDLDLPEAVVVRHRLWDGHQP